jgi:hypothetical protein
MQATELSAFHRWLLAETPSGMPSIAVHGSAALPRDLVQSVARHLNEFDEDSGGHWLAFAQELIEQIAGSETQRGLLVLGEHCQCEAPGPACNPLRRTVEGLAARGHAIFEGALATDVCQGNPNVFCVWLGYPPDRAGMLHLILHPEHFNEHSLPAIIADTFLEWSNARLLHSTR